jgi:hypothetical protein
MEHLNDLPQKSQPLILNLNEGFILSDLYQNQGFVDAMAKDIKKHLSCTDEEAYSYCIKAEKAAKNKLSTTVSNLRGQIVQTTMSIFYEEHHPAYGIKSAIGGYWEFLPKNDYAKHLQNKDRVTIDKVNLRMLERDPTNAILRQIRDLTKLL